MGRIGHYFIILIFMALGLTACGGHSGGSSNPSISKIQIDQVSQIPLINGKTQQFYVYATNVGNITVNNMDWTIQAENNPEVQGLWLKSKNKIKNIFSKVNNTDNGMNIIDSSDCTSLKPEQTCRLVIEANKPGVFKLNLNSGSQALSLLGGGGVLQADTYTTVNTGNTSDILTVTPLGEVSYTDNMGSASFFVINNGDKPVSFDFDKLMSNLPANVQLVQAYCTNPIPSGVGCQIRVIINNTTPNSEQDLLIPIELGGEIIDNDSTISLSKQNGDINIKATSKQHGIIQYVFSQSVILDNSFDNLTHATTNAIISNTGSSALTINSLIPSGNILSVSNDNCSGKTLGQGEMCSYTINLDVAKIFNNGNEQVLIAYVDQISAGASSVNSNVSWTYIAPLPLANPSINMTVSSNMLDQLNPTTSIVITNNGNVDLSNISAPVMNTPNSKIIITNGSNACTGTLAVGSTCSYTLTYNPVAPSDNDSIVFSGVSASHSNNRGATVTTTFSQNSVGVNIFSTFEGLLTSNSELALNESITTGALTFVNSGNYTATISKVELSSSSSSNIAIDGGTCTLGKVLDIGQSCTVNLRLNNSTASGSGNASIIVSYDNHNGTTNASSSNSNISWLIRQAPSLQVHFVSSSLITPITFESATEVILTNNGRDNLTNLVIPILSNPFAYAPSTSNGCTNGQNLNMGESCSLVLTYSPITKQSQISESLPSFGATYSNNGVSTIYTTQPYAITIAALSLGELSFNPMAVSQRVNWVVTTQSSSVTITNIGAVEINIGSITSDNGSVISSQCNSLQADSSCDFTITSSYAPSTVNRTENEVITVPFTDVSGSHSQMLNLTANYQAMPVVTPNLTIVSSLFGSSLVKQINETVSYPVTLTNNSTVTNDGDANISIPYSSLMPSSDSMASYSINTQGITNNPCPLPSVGNSMTLLSGNSCSYNLVLTTGNTATASDVKTISTIYQYNQYDSSSTAPTLIDAPVISNSFDLELVAKAELVISVVAGEESKFNAIEQGTTDPTMDFTITNIGSLSVNGAITNNLPSGISAVFNNCDNLAAKATCTMQLTMSTANTISGNLSSYVLTYNDQTASVVASFPSISYSVMTFAEPVISLSTSVTGCAVGNGVSSTCLNNPDSNGGSASNTKIVLTFTNSSADTAASLVSLPSASESVFTNNGYTLGNNTCTGGTATNNGTCVMEYNIPSSASSSSMQTIINQAALAFDYIYAIPSSGSRTGSSTGAVNVSISVDMPVLTIATIADIPKGESQVITITTSNIYRSTIPSVTLNLESANGGSPIGITTNPVTCNAVVSNGSTCTSSIKTSNTTIVASDYKLIATSMNVSNVASFNVTAIPEWRYVGAQGFALNATEPQLAFDSTGVPYIGYLNGERPMVMKYINTVWSEVGDTSSMGGGILVGGVWNGFVINSINNQPYLAYSSDSFNIGIINYNSSAWQSMQTSINNYGGLNFVIDNLGEMYLVTDNIYKYTGSTWDMIYDFQGQGLSSFKLLIQPNTNTPYFAYQDGNDNFKIRVKKYNGSTWDMVGSVDARVNRIDMAFDPLTNQPTIVYQDASNNNAVVIAFNGTTWQKLGADVFTGSSYVPQIAYSPANNQPYVAMSDSDGKGNVKRYNGSAWVAVGATNFITGGITDLEFNPITNQPYIVTEGQGSVMKLE